MKDEYGYDCACGKHHHYPPYVIAHQNVELVHTCECGRKNSILGLVAEIGNLPNNSVYPTLGILRPLQAVYKPQPIQHLKQLPSAPSAGNANR
jgi:hypothetical protein